MRNATSSCCSPTCWGSPPWWTDAPRSFFAFYNPAPEDDVFAGFNTDRIAPIGEFTLSAAAPDHIVGTFSVTVFPLADGAVAPDGSDSAVITDGTIDLRYR